MKLLHALLVACALVALQAQARQDPAPVRQAVDDFLRIQTSGLPGQVSYTVGSLAADNRLAPCHAFEASMPPGAGSWGRTHVAVRCQGQPGWSVFVPVHIRVVADYLVTARPLAQGQSVAATDLTRQRGDLSNLPAGILTDERQAVGRTAIMAVAAGRPVRADMLRAPVAVQQNQMVRLVSKGPGFEVTNEGKALTQAVDGQVVQVRLASGEVVSGIARLGGVVEVGF